MKKMILCLLVSLVMAVSSSCFPTTQPNEVVANYQENKAVFVQAAEICQKYEIRYLVWNWELPEKGSSNFSEEEIETFQKITKEERRIVERCLKLRCRAVWYNTKESYIDFAIPRDDGSYQGIFYFLSGANISNVETLLHKQMPYEKDIVYQKLDENAYYYYLSGGKPTESDPGTVTDHIPEE